MYPKPGFVVWLLTFVGVGLFVATLWHFLDQVDDAGRSEAAGMLMVGGIAAAGSIWRLVTRYRTAAQVADIAQIAIGVPIRPARGKALAVAIFTLAIGAVPLLVMKDLTPVNRWFAWLFVLAGAGVAMAVAARILPAGYILFRDDGLVVATRGAPLVLPWERIRAVEGGEFGGTPSFFLWLDDAETLEVAPAQRPAFMRRVGMCRSLMQCDYYLPTASYAIGLPTFVAAIDQYRAKPTSVV